MHICHLAKTQCLFHSQDAALYGIIDVYNLWCALAPILFLHLLLLDPLF